MKYDCNCRSPLAIITGQQTEPLPELIASMALISKSKLEDLPLAGNLKNSVSRYYKVLLDTTLPTKELALMTLTSISPDKIHNPYDKFNP